MKLHLNGYCMLNIGLMSIRFSVGKKEKCWLTLVCRRQESSSKLNNAIVNLRSSLINHSDINHQFIIIIFFFKPVKLYSSAHIVLKLEKIWHTQGWNCSWRT
ncbi:hypothetical protein L1987_63412 [Smallanthus sonchifolius]|uniref:Uncharacterized protein n=1 Tax=Smallanthus sonchifolius TaxID=185202 RepID=A0ACB9CDG1_9ASTR|nr:hypothetical protein L1987_63412 [Smallanthus sonchifolius]